MCASAYVCGAQRQEECGSFCYECARIRLPSGQVVVRPLRRTTAELADDAPHDASQPASDQQTAPPPTVRRGAFTLRALSVNHNTEQFYLLYSYYTYLNKMIIFYMKSLFLNH